jgi:hypothetical protein
MGAQNLTAEVWGLGAHAEKGALGGEKRYWAHSQRRAPPQVPRLAGLAYVPAVGRRGVATGFGGARLRSRRGATRSAPFTVRLRKVPTGQRVTRLSRQSESSAK